MSTKTFSFSRVVTRNFVTDMFQGIRNTFGLRLRGYEQIINKTTEEMLEEMKEKYSSIKWFRINTNPFDNDACLVTVYGVYSEDE